MYFSFVINTCFHYYYYHHHHLVNMEGSKKSRWRFLVGQLYRDSLEQVSTFSRVVFVSLRPGSIMNSSNNNTVSLFMFLCGQPAIVSWTSSSCWTSQGASRTSTVSRSPSPGPSPTASPSTTTRRGSAPSSLRRTSMDSSTWVTTPITERALSIRSTSSTTGEKRTLPQGWRLSVTLYSRRLRVTGLASRTF